MTDDCTPQAPKLTDAHRQLAAMTGDWSGTTRVWFEPGKVGDESPVRGTIRSALDDRFIVFEYTGALGGKPLAGLLLFGFHIDRNRFEAAWIDSFHCGSAIMSSTGEPGAADANVLGHYGPPGGEWGWRTALALEASGELVITAWNIAPDGQEDLAVETRLKRVVSRT